MSRARTGKSDSPVPYRFNASSTNPLEAHPEHRAFLIRSLDRCDLEFTALTELNRSLHRVKAAIEKTCGEGTLLDIGEGLIKLTPSEDDLVGLRIPEQGQDLCVEFLLRMKLRRRLLNRLTRRLNRLAQAMDGQDVSPPIPPKYGDLRLHLDPAQVQEYASHWEKQEAAKMRMKERHSTEKESSNLVVAESTPSSTPTFEQEYDVLKEYKDSYEKALLPSTGVIKYTILDQPHGTDHVNIKFGAGIGASHRTMSTRENEAEYKRWQTALLAKIPDQPTFGEIGMEHLVFALEERRKRIAEGVSASAQKKVKIEEAVAKNGSDKTDDDKEEIENDTSEITAGSSDEKALKKQDFSAKAESKSNDDTMQVDVGTQPDGIKEKIQKVESTTAAKHTSEYKIDDTVDQADSDTAENNQLAVNVEPGFDGESKSDSEGYDSKGEDEDDESSKSGDDDESGTEDQKPTQANKNRGTEDDNEEFKNSVPIIPKQIKPISLLAVPSFHEQDMKRIRIIHADLMATSITDHARLRITETTTDYNDAYRQSTEIYHRRVKCQEDYQTKAQAYRMEIAKMNNDYSMRVSIAKGRYYKDLQNWNLQKARQVMQSMQGQMPVGTHRTQMASGHSNPIVNSIGLTLGRVVDAVILKAKRGSYDGEMFKPFQQPPPLDVNNIVVDRNTGETIKERQTRLDNDFHNEMGVLNSRFQKSEQDRERAWRKLLKTKAEFDGGRRRFDPNLMPLPSLRSSGMVATPAVAPPTAAVATYVPQNRTYAGPESQSKYSAARIRGRISSDGSVMPASEPKKNKDGLFIRPAGRKRAGMDWDAHRGIWVPETQDQR